MVTDVLVVRGSVDVDELAGFLSVDDERSDTRPRGVVAGAFGPAGAEAVVAAMSPSRCELGRAQLLDEV